MRECLRCKNVYKSIFDFSALKQLGRYKISANGISNQTISHENTKTGRYAKKNQKMHMREKVIGDLTFLACGETLMIFYLRRQRYIHRNDVTLTSCGMGFLLFNKPNILAEETSLRTEVEEIKPLETSIIDFYPLNYYNISTNGISNDSSIKPEHGYMKRKSSKN